MRWIFLVPVAVLLSSVSYVLAATTLRLFWEGDRLANGLVGGPWWDSFLTATTALPAAGTFVAISYSVAPSLKKIVAILSTGAIVLLAAVIVLFDWLRSPDGAHIVFVLRSSRQLPAFIAGASLVTGAVVVFIHMWREESRRAGEPKSINTNSSPEVDLTP
jgi:hypothetical protein